MYFNIFVPEAAVVESGGSRVVRRMLFDADEREPAAANSRRLSLPALPLNSAAAAADSHRQHKTPTKCNLILLSISNLFFVVNSCLMLIRSVINSEEMSDMSVLYFC